MLTIISPAKTLDYESALITNKFSQPQQLDQSKILIERSRQLTVKQLEELMKISPALATLNHQRFAKWQTPFTPENARQAILAFKGDVYEGLHVEDFSNPDFDFAQDNLRILSGLYGLLRPLDLIEPYRLEMGIRLDNPRGKNLYEFWGDLINALLHEQLSEHPDAVLINLASDEYFKAVNRKKLNFPIIKPIFLDEKRGEFKTISFYAKKARGLMSRFIIKNQITSPKALPEFNLAGYQFNKSQSTETELVFKRTEKEAQLQQR